VSGIFSDSLLKDRETTRYTSQQQQTGYNNTQNSPNSVSDKTAMGDLISNQKALLNTVNLLLQRYPESNKQSAKSTFLNAAIRSALIVAFIFLIFKVWPTASGGGGTHSLLSGLTPTYTPIVHTGKTFDDIKGIDECKEEVMEIVQFLKNPEEFARLGGKLPRGVMLSGPPGTGKTLIAKAIAGEAGVPFFYASGAEFDGMLVGLGAKRISSLFESAKRHAPAIIFIDEIDALGGKRGVTSENYHRQTINQFLSELDGFNTQDGIIVIGATNFLEVLDPALTRPGRFDKKIHVPLPNLHGRLDILSLYLKNIPTAKDLDIQRFASKSVGFSGAELENLVNTASIRASKVKHDTVTNADLDYAFDRVLMGLERRNLVDQKDRYVTAVHETGHALMTILSDKSSELHKLTVMPRGGALGFMASLQRKDVVSVTKSEMYAKINVLLGGVIAEEIIFGKENVTSGASNDLERATHMARNMVEKYGMSSLGLSVFERNDKEISPETKREIDLEVRRIINECYDRTKHELVTNEKALRQIADVLIEYETLTGSEVQTLLQGGKLNRKPTDDIQFGQQ
jgi:ATP-dependent metalloprotease